MKIKRFSVEIVRPNGVTKFHLEPDLETARRKINRLFWVTLGEAIGKDYYIPAEYILEGNCIHYRTSAELIEKDLGGWHIYNGNGEDYICRISEVEIPLSEEEEKATAEAYTHMRHLYAAENAVLSVAGFDISKRTCTENAEAQKRFEKKFGFRLADATKPESPHYILEDCVRIFESYYASDIPEKQAWHAAACRALFQH